MAWMPTKEDLAQTFRMIPRQVNQTTNYQSNRTSHRFDESLAEFQKGSIPHLFSCGRAFNLQLSGYIPTGNNATQSLRLNP